MTLALALKVTLPAFFTSFTIFAFFRFICHKLGLDNDASVGREFETRQKYLQSIGLTLEDNAGLSSGAGIIGQTRNCVPSNQDLTNEETNNESIELAENV